MEKTVTELIAAISPDDWDRMPTSILNLIEELVGRIDRLEQSMSEQNRPGKYDVILGSQNPQTQAPLDGVILGTFSKSTVNLQALLQQQRWEAADLETQTIMLEICQRQADGFLRVEDLDKINCFHWRTINNLWRTYSNDRFGLSVQAEIWRSVGGTSEPDWDAWCRFGKLAGWYINDDWLYWNDVRFDLNAPRGHLPRNGAWMGWGLGDFWIGCTMLDAIVKKLESCQII
jgi:GUN4-like